MTLLLLLTVGSAVVSVESKIDSVVVYPNQVMVVRTASASVSGPGEIVFEDLPGALLDNSVRIKAPGMRIGEVQVKRGYIDEPTATVRGLKDRVEELERGLKELVNDQEVLKAKEEFLKSVTLGAPGLMSTELQQGKVSPEAWRSALSFVGRELAAVKDEMLDLEQARRDNQELLNAARQEYNAARAEVENRKDVSFSFAAPAGVYRVQLAYVIRGGANWVPYYELRAQPDKDKVGLTYYARLTQATGEDWDRVKVVLSTAKPALVVKAPEPTPWYLSLVDLYAYRARKQAEQRVMLSANQQKLDNGILATNEEFSGLPVFGEGSRMEASAPPPVFVEETGISLQYVVPGRVSLKSGEPTKKLQLHEADLAVEFGYYCLPRVRAQAFLAGKMVNTTEFVILDGEANTYVGDEFTGTTWLDASAPQESTEVSFGIDERVKVSRELVKSYKTKGGLFTKNEKLQFWYKTTVENYHPEAIEIKLVELVPVSQQKEIKVAVSSVEPKQDELDKEKGLYTWTRVVEPRGKLELNVEFSVEYPAGKRVQGLF